MPIGQHQQLSKIISKWSIQVLIIINIDLFYLNRDEYEHVEKLIKNNADRFQIPGEPLEATNVLQHSISIVDDSDFFNAI